MENFDIMYDYFLSFSGCYNQQNKPIYFSGKETEDDSKTY